MPNAIRAYPLSDVNGRNTGKEITDASGNKKYGEYITYRKVGDHATNMPATVYYGMLQNGKYGIGDNLKYKYDSCGNIAEVFENGSLSVKYTYDSLNRLIREDNRKLNKTYLYTYDSCGNILSKRVTAYTVKEEREIASYTEEKQYGYAGDRLISYGGAAIVYDIYGNPTSYKGNTLTWQYGKRLTKYGTTTFTYDGYGRRTKKGSVVFTYDANGNLVKQTDGTNTLEFIYDGNGLSGFNCNGTNYLYRKNAQGDITHILSADTGTVVAKYVYDAWGNYSLTGDETLGELNPFRYRGYYYDTETDLYYLQTRYYDPETGRFISQDDVSYLDPEAINGLNLYAYCGNNPVMNVDPNGTEWWHWLIGAIVAVAVVAAAVVTAGAIVAVAPAVATAVSSIALSLGASASVAGFVAGAVSIGAAALAVSTIVIGVNEALNIVSGYNILSFLMGEDIYNGFRNTIGITSAIFVTAGMNLPYPSTGSTTPNDLREQVAMHRALSNPDKGSVVPITMHDPRMPGWLGWTKYQLSFPLSDGTSITIHYVGNRYFPSWLSPYFDFKFKN